MQDMQASTWELAKYTSSIDLVSHVFVKILHGETGASDKRQAGGRHLWRGRAVDHYHYRKRHDAYKMRLFQMCQWAGLDAEVEVFNLLAGSIPQEGLNRMERGPKVQSIVPAMRISIPEEGNFVS